jgi:prophage tail gpP-like protein
VALQDGQSELDSVTIRFPGTGTTLHRFEHYRITSRFLTPCDQFEFTIGDDDVVVADELCVPGASVEIAVNDRMVLTGAIDKKSIQTSRHGGTAIHVVGRDILGPVVSSNIDPKFQFAESLTVLDVAAAVLAQFGITTVYNDGALDVSVKTGATKKPSVTSQSVSVQLPTLTVDDTGALETSFATVPIKHVVGKNPSLKTIQLQQLKPRFGEGAYEYLSRVCRRFGFHVWAAADGTGVVIAGPDFDTKPLYEIRHTRGADSNVLDSRVEFDLDSQPSCIVAQSVHAPQHDEAKTTARVIMVNELVGTDSEGNVLPEVQNIIARYKGSKVLGMRTQLQPLRRRFNDTLVSRPMFVKDEESRSLAQLEAFVRRTMAEHQHRALMAQYTVDGHTQNGVPWSINATSEMRDEVSGLLTPLWIMERTFEKSRNAGTVTHVSLVRPHTLALS